MWAMACMSLFIYLLSLPSGQIRDSRRSCSPLEGPARLEGLVEPQPGEGSDMNPATRLAIIERPLACRPLPESFFWSGSENSRRAFDKIKHSSAFPGNAVIFVEGQSAGGIL